MISSLKWVHFQKEWFQRQGISSCPATSLPCVYKAGRGQARPCLVWPRHPLSQGQDVVCTIGQIKMLDLVRFAGSESHNITVPQLLDKYCIVYTGLFFSSPKGKGKAGFIYQFSVPMQQPICFCFRGSLYFNFHQIPSCLVQPMTSLDNLLMSYTNCVNGAAYSRQNR